MPTRDAAVKPRNLDELLDLLPGLRRRRDLNADLLRLLLDRRPGECTWCGDPVAPGRRNWCGDGCVKAFNARCSSGTARSIVVKRDGGTCRRCGRDTFAAEAEAVKRRLTAYPWRQPGESDQEFSLRCEVAAAELLALGYARGRWREVDHDPPVVEYGGLCDPAQLRLLCGTCHAEVTAALSRRRKRSVT